MMTEGTNPTLLLHVLRNTSLVWGQNKNFWHWIYNQGYTQNKNLVEVGQMGIKNGSWWVSHFWVLLMSRAESEILVTHSHVTNLGWSGELHSSPKETHVHESCIWLIPLKLTKWKFHDLSDLARKKLFVTLICLMNNTIFNKSASVCLIAMRFELFRDLTETTCP